MLWQRGKSYSQDLRSRVLVAADEGARVGQIALTLRVSVSYVSKVLGRRLTGEVSARPQRCRLERKLSDLHEAIRAEVLLLLARILRAGNAASVRELHGATRWATRGELVRSGFFARFGGLYLGTYGGFLGRHLRFGGSEHIACYAPTRSGKGVGLVIPNALLYEATLVCLDVKKENYAATAGARTLAGQRVFLFDPLDPTGRTAYASSGGH